MQTGTLLPPYFSHYFFYGDGFNHTQLFLKFINRIKPYKSTTFVFQFLKDSNDMKKTLFLILASIAVLLSSCGKKNAEKLLQTIPQNTQFLAMVNADNLAHDLGDEGEKQLDQFVANLSKSNKASDKLTKYILSKDSQADLTEPFFFFEFNNAAIITFFVKDEDKFRSDIEGTLASEFSKENDVWHLADNTVFVKGNQAWITQKYPEIKPSEISSFTKIPKTSSMASVEYAVEMVEKDADVSALIDIKGILQTNMNMSANLFLNMAFEDPRYLSYYMNFEKGKIQGEAVMLNEKYQPAPFSLRPSKINAASLSAYPGKGNMFLAAAFDSATISKIIGQVKGFAPVPPEIIKALENIDGNIVMSSYVTGQNQQPEQVGAMITFKDPSFAQECAEFLNGMLASEGTSTQCRADGKSLIVSTPGELGQPIGAVAKDFEGAGLGFVLDTSGLNSQATGNIGALFSQLVVKLVDNGASSNLEFNISTARNQNSLVSLLQFINSSNTKQ